MDRMGRWLLEKSNTWCCIRILYSIFRCQLFREKWCDRMPVVRVIEIFQIRVMDVVSDSTVVEACTDAVFLRLGL